MCVVVVASRESAASFSGSIASRCMTLGHSSAYVTHVMGPGLAYCVPRSDGK